MRTWRTWVNEAALLAARRNRKAITMEDIEEASMKVMAGPEKKSRVVTPRGKEADRLSRGGPRQWQASTASTIPACMRSPLSPRGQAGGYTMYLPEKDRSYVTKGGDV